MLCLWSQLTPVEQCMSDALDIVTRLQRLAEFRTKNPNVEADESRCLTQNTITKSHALSRAYYRFGLVVWFLGAPSCWLRRGRGRGEALGFIR